MDDGQNQKSQWTDEVRWSLLDAMRRREIWFPSSLANATAREDDQASLLSADLTTVNLDDTQEEAFWQRLYEFACETDFAINGEELLEFLADDDALHILQASPFVGFSIAGVRIKGHLSFNSGVLNFPLRFFGCRFDHPIDVANARIFRLELKGCHLTGIDGRRAQLNSDLKIIGSKCDGPLNLHAAKISGSLDLSRSSLMSSYEEYLIGERRANPTRFTEYEPISLTDRLTVSSAQIEDDLIFEGTDIRGWSNLIGTAIGRLLLISNSRLGIKQLVEPGEQYLARRSSWRFTPHIEEASRLSLHARGMTVGDSVVFQNSALYGLVTANNARIGGDIQIDHSVFFFPHRICAIFDSTAIDGQFQIQSSSFCGCIRARQCQVEGSVTISSSIFAGPFDPQADLILPPDFRGKSKPLEHPSDFSWNPIALPAMDLIGSEFGETFTLTRSWIIGALLLEDIRVFRDFTLTHVNVTHVNVSEQFEDNRPHPSFPMVIRDDDGTWERSEFKDIFEIWNTSRPYQLRGDEYGLRAVCLSDARLERDLNLESLHWDQFGWLDLQGAVAQRLRDLENSWPDVGKLYLDGFDYQRIHGDTVHLSKRRAWLMLQAPSHLGHDFRAQPWEQLTRFLHKRGAVDMARKVSIEYKDRAVSSGVYGPWLGIVYRFFGATCRYGLQPWLAICWLAIILATSTGLLYLADRHDLIVPANDSVMVALQSGRIERIPDHYPQFNPFLYSLDIVLPVGNLFQEKYYYLKQMEDMNGNTLQGVLYYALRFYLPFHVIFGWLLISLSVLSFSGVFERRTFSD